MGRRFALQAEVAVGPHQAFAEALTPERLTATRAVSGFSGDTSQRAKAKSVARGRGVDAAERRQERRLRPVRRVDRIARASTRALPAASPSPASRRPPQVSHAHSLRPCATRRRCASRYVVRPSRDARCSRPPAVRFAVASSSAGGVSTAPSKRFAPIQRPTSSSPSGRL